MDPSFDSADRDPIEMLAEEFLDRKRAGEFPTIEEYMAKHPALARRIRRVFPALIALESAAIEAHSANAPPAIPQRLGDFRIVRELGRGGMGIVYEAIQETLDRPVALKVIPPVAALDSSFLDRFRQEARTAAKLHHTNIVPVYEVSEQQGFHLLAMQLIRGIGLDLALARLRGASSSFDSLKDNIGSNTPLGNARATPLATAMTDEGPAIELHRLYHCERQAYYRKIAELIRQVASGLAYAHSQGVIHRDIKPANLLLDREGNLWVSDFGLAKADGSHELTRTGVIVGTTRYVAPERFLEQESPVADIYSLGSTFYELLTLKQAHDSKDRIQLIQQIQTIDPVRPRSICADIPIDLETIVEKSMVKEPSRRYTASELADDLERFLLGLPVLARRVSPMHKLLLWSKRNPKLASLTFALFLSLSLGLAASLFFGFRAEANRKNAVKNLALYQAEFRRAEQQRDLAERRRKDALQAVDESFTVISENQLLEKPGAQGLRRDLLETSLRYYEKYLAERKDDAAIAKEHAAALMRLSNIQSTLGNRLKAIEIGLRAKSAYQKVIESNPSVQNRIDFGVVLMGLGLDYGARRELEPALENFAAAEKELDLAAKSAPQELLPNYRLARVYLSRASFHSSRSKHSAADKDYHSARAVLEHCEKLAPKNTSVLVSIGETQLGIGIFCFTNGRAGQSLKELDKAEQAVRKAGNIRGNSWRVESLLADIYSQRAMAYFTSNRLDDALKAIKEADHRLQRLIQESEEVPKMRFQRGSNLSRMARINERIDRHDDALQCSKDACVIIDSLAKDYPDDLNYQQFAGNCHCDIGFRYLARGNTTDAMKSFKKSQLLFDVVAANPNVRPFDISMAAVVYRGLGDVHLASGQVKEAKGAYWHSVELQKRVLKLVPDSFDMAQFLSEYFLKWAKAAAAEKNGKEICEKLAEVKPWITNDREALYSLAQLQAKITPIAEVDTVLLTLKMAAEAGYRDAKAIKADAAFAHLRPSPGFEKFLVQIATSPNKKTQEQKQPKVHGRD